MANDTGDENGHPTGNKSPNDGFDHETLEKWEAQARYRHFFIVKTKKLLDGDSF